MTDNKPPAANPTDETVTLIDANAAVGDIFYFQLCGRYYFIQIIDIKQLDGVYRWPVYIHLFVVFEKSFSKLPKNIDELDLQRIYRIKYKPKNSLLYIMWHEFERRVSISKNSSAGFEKYRDIKLHLFGYLAPAPEFMPSIVIPDSYFPIRGIENAEGIDITPGGAHFTFIYDRIEQDLRQRDVKLASFTPVYFKTWTDEVEPGSLLKMEKILAELDRETDQRAFLKHLKKAVARINKLQERDPFIYTLEAEDIWNALQEMTERHQFPSDEAWEIVEQGREW